MFVYLSGRGFFNARNFKYRYDLASGRATRKQYPSEEKLQVVLEGLRGNQSIAAPCRIEPNALILLCYERQRGITIRPDHLRIQDPQTVVAQGLCVQGDPPLFHVRWQ